MGIYIALFDILVTPYKCQRLSVTLQSVEM